MFVCDIPLEMMTLPFLKDFAGSAIASIFEQILEPEYGHPPAGQGSGIVIHQSLAPEFIVGHYTPKRLRDPLIGGYVQCA